MRLSRYEKETIILLNAAEDTASIYTADPVWKRKLDKLVEKNPQCYQCVKADEVSKTYSMPKRFISLRSKEKTVTLTAEQKALPALGGPMGADLIKCAVLRADLMNLAGLLQLFQLAVYRGQPHGISAQPQLFGQSRCADGLFAALLQTLQHGLLLFGTI